MNTQCFGLLLAVAVGSVGCNDVSWQQENLIDSVRILGVKAEPASLSPGQSTQLTLLCADGARGGEANPTCNVEVAWFAHCDNPKENDPSHCFAQYRSWKITASKPLSDLDMSKYQGAFALGPVFQYVLPSDVLQGKVSVSGQVVRYGTSYVYYAVCAGRLYSTAGSSERLPVECRDRETGKVLDQRKFVVGRTTLYSYDVIRNPNPEIATVGFDGTRIPLTNCVTNTDCGGNLECHRDGTCAPVVAPCKNRNEPGCRAHYLDLRLTRASFFPEGIDGSTLTAAEKSLWVTYYTNAGSTPDDFAYGFTPEGQAQPTDELPIAFWRAPAYVTEEARLWFVVRDDRGGQAWHVQPVIVR
jgi:hypothetical protein